MILVDLNLLIYAVNEDAVQHSEAQAWLESVLSGREMVGFAWVVLLGFLRLTTRAGMFSRPLPITGALDLMDEWLEQPSATLVEPGQRHASILRDLLVAGGTGGNITTDAHLAALAIEHRAELLSLDHDFARFPGLRWRDPLRRSK